MISNDNSFRPPNSDCTLRDGFRDSPSKALLRDLLNLAAGFTGTQVALLLHDTSGIWYRSSCGLTQEELAHFEPAESQYSVQEAKLHLFKVCRLHIIETMSFMNDANQSIGSLFLVSHTLLPLTKTQRAGLKILEAQLQTIIFADAGSESHTTQFTSSPRTLLLFESFVRGLVHELGSFNFGISAILDACEARFADMGTFSYYGARIRKSLDRLNDLLAELREYGRPLNPSGPSLEFGPLLYEIVERHVPTDVTHPVHLHLQIDGDLPAIQADQRGIQTAFTNLIELALRQEGQVCRVELHLERRHSENRALICGHLEFSGGELKSVDPTRLFDPFYFQVSGLGRLALPVARRVFEAHGGTLAASRDPDGGIRISFMLPSEMTYPLR